MRAVQGLGIVERRAPPAFAPVILLAGLGIISQSPSERLPGFLAYCRPRWRSLGPSRSDATSNCSCRSAGIGRHKTPKENSSPAHWLTGEPDTERWTGYWWRPD